jgi:hypothetical protein
LSIITDSDLATFLGRPNIEGTAQAVLAANIGSALVLDLLNNDGVLGSTTVTRTLDGPTMGTSTIVIPGYPVTAVTDVQELVIDTVSGPTWNDLVEGVNYTWSEYGILSKFGTNDSTDGQKISGTVMGSFPGQFWTHLQQGIMVTYTYGLATVPYVVQYVALSAAARIYVNPTNYMRESIGGYEYQYNPRAVSNFASLPPDEVAILGRYMDGVVG